MPTPTTSRWLVTLIPIVASMAVSVAIAIVTNNPLSLLFGLMMPVMMLVPALERWFERRRARQVRRDEIRAEALRYPSPRELLELWPRRVPEWTLAGHDDAQAEHHVRLGLDASGGVVRVDARAGVNIVGDLMRRERVARAIACSIVWSHGVSSPTAQVELDDAGGRWLIGVRSDGTGFVVDRTGSIPDYKYVMLDQMTTGDHERFVELVKRYRVDNEIHSLDWDLFSEGPHALVSGVTGSGKTVLLRQWVTKLATDVSTPATVGVIDFKGGGGFGDLVTNGLVASLATNLDPETVELALDGLRALLRRRAALLAEHSCLALDEIPSDARPPRAVIIVDEYRALLDEFPQAQHLFVDIASRGRALGLHLILATQRFTGVAGDALTSNCGIRVALRAGDAMESRQVIGVPDACDSQLQPGEGLVVVPGRAVRRIRIALDALPVGRANVTHANRLWLEPLAELPTWRELDDTGLDPSRIRLGLVDDHESLCRSVLNCNPTGQAMLLIGGARADRENLLTAIGQQLDAVTLPRDAVGAWDALAEAGEPTGFVLHNVDALELELPLAWREAFSDLLMRRARAAIAAGLPVAVSVVSDVGVARQLRNLPHQVVTMHVDLPTLDGQSFIAVRAAPEVNSTLERAIDSVEGFSDALLISPHADSWRARGVSGLTVADVEDIVFGRVTRSDFTRVFIDGCSPMDARSMRLSAEHIPPPQAGTVLEVDESGRYRRVALTAEQVRVSEL